MAYIYKITNLINQKIYVGKTLDNIDKRWKEHCHDAFRDKNEQRPLYSAIRKYGVENFFIEAIEECSAEDANDREKFWIEALGSYHFGYNATLGGDGKAYADYDLICRLWEQGYMGTEITEITGYCSQTVKRALDNAGIIQEERTKRQRESISKHIAMLEKGTDNILKTFPSIQAAYDFLGKQHSGHIAAVCQGKRKSAYGYSWKYL